MPIIRPDPSGSPGVRQRTQAPSIQGEIEVAQANRQVGQEIEAIGAKYISDTAATLQTETLNRNLTKATLDFNRRVQERTGRLTDEEGNPLHTSLVADVGGIADEVRQDTLNNIQDEEVKARFESSFSELKANKQLQAFGNARQQHQSFSVASLSESVQNISLAAIEDDPTLTEQYINQISDMFDDALQSGTISPEQAFSGREAAAESIRVNALNKGILNAPGAALESIQEAKASELGITEGSRQKLVKIAGAAVRDRQREAERVRSEKEKEFKSRMNLTVAQSELAVMKGEMGEAEILKLLEDDQIDEMGAIKLQKQVLRADKSATKKTNSFIGIEESRRVDGHVTAAPSQVNSWYDEQVRVMEEAQGEEMSLPKKAMLATTLNAPIGKFVQELEFGIMHNEKVKNPQELVASFEMLESNHPLGLDGLSDEARTIISIVSLDSLSPNVDLNVRLGEARQAVLDPPKGQRARLGANYRRVGDFKLDSIKSTAESEVRSWDTDEDEVDTNITNEFDTVARTEYIRNGGNTKAAKAVASAKLKAVSGVTSVTGGDRLMLFPPEKVFGDFLNGTRTDGSQFTIEEMQKDLEDAITPLLPEGIEFEDVRLDSAPTRSRIRGKITTDWRLNPVWHIRYKNPDTGEDIPFFQSGTSLPLVWGPDVSGIISQRKIDAAERAKVNEKNQGELEFLEGLFTRTQQEQLADERVAEALREDI